MTPEFVLSLDFELLWGVRDHADRDSYGAHVMGGRAAIPRLLDLFAQHDIACSWATVGFLFAEDRDDLLAALPDPDQRPRYANPALSNYAYLDEVGRDEAADPYYFGLSLIRQIAATPRQEIGTHTLSHYYALEDGACLNSFEADLIGAIDLARAKGITLRSIVFPRNQYTEAHVALCTKHGVTTHRGNPPAWVYQPAKGAEQTPLRRALRLIDAHTGLLGSQTYAVPGDRGDVPASMFLRPKAGKLAALHPAHVATIKRGMHAAATSGRGYHLWWHPHNFGRDTDQNLAALSEILLYFNHLKETYGMQSRPMASEVSQPIDHKRDPS